MLSKLSIWSSAFERFVVVRIICVQGIKKRQFFMTTLDRRKRFCLKHSRALLLKGLPDIKSSPTPPATTAALASSSVTVETAHEDGKQPLPFSAIPGPRGVAQWPILGAIMLFKPFNQMLDNLFQQYGPIVRCQLRGTTVLIRDISDVETVFRNEGIYPDRPSLELPSQFAKRNNVKDGFNEVQGEAWYKLRSPLTRRLARVNSATYYMQDQNIVADELVAILLSGARTTPRELSDIFFRFTAESIGLVCFNTRLGFLDPDYASRPDTVAYLHASKAIFRLLHDEIRGRSIFHSLYRNKTYREFEAVQHTLKRGCQVWTVGRMGKNFPTVALQPLLCKVCDSMTWKHPSAPVTKKFKVQRSAAKVMATVFWDAKGVILLDILPQ
ncbi:cytochrome p450 10-like, partial [Plakobranchus ocellatus]